MIKFKGIKNHLFFFALLFIGSCNGCKEKPMRIFSGEPVEVNLLRFERDLFDINPAEAEKGLLDLHKKYRHFYRSYARDILAMQENENDTLFLKPMSMVIAYEPFKTLQKSIDSTFGDLSEIKTELGKAMGIYKTQFPNYRVPDFVTFLSEYGYATVNYDTLIGIGLDFYMNQTHYAYYKALEFPEYMIKKLQKEYIIPNTVKAVAIGQYEEQTYRDKRFLAMMIFEGKVRYFAKALLPQTQDTLILGCTAKQLQWCYDNEPEMWAHYIEKELLYKNEPSQFIRYFNDGPFTSAEGVPAESAPAIGAWTGLQIVIRYMNNYPEITLQQLMEETDFDKILKLSKYRPDR